MRYGRQTDFGIIKDQLFIIQKQGMASCSERSQPYFFIYIF